MKIGDEIYVHGYIDEIRKDIVIIRNDGGYFGTVPSEVITERIKRLEPQETEKYEHMTADEFAELFTERDKE